MKDYSFDVKVFVTARVRAPDEATARAFIDERLPMLVEGSEIMAGSVYLVILAAGLDGEHDLTEVDGEPT